MLPNYRLLPLSVNDRGSRFSSAEPWNPELLTNPNLAVTIPGARAYGSGLWARFQEGTEKEQKKQNEPETDDSPQGSQALIERI